MKKSANLFLYLISLLTYNNAAAIESTEFDEDPHYNSVGFFDMHICNWPDRPHFFKVLFSSDKFKQIESMRVSTPENQPLVTLDHSKFRIIKRNNKPDKRVYMLDIDVPQHASTGWYTIDVTTDSGEIFQAKDYVIMSKLQRVSQMQPSGDETIENAALTLKWIPVAGSQYYQIYLRDEWTGKLIYSSKLLDTPYITIPEGKIQQGGYYSWSVHARDTNEHVLLGDFHMGSISKKAFFTVNE